MQRVFALPGFPGCTETLGDSPEFCLALVGGLLVSSSNHAAVGGDSSFCIEQCVHAVLCDSWLRWFVGVANVGYVRANSGRVGDNGVERVCRCWEVSARMCGDDLKNGVGD